MLRCATIPILLIQVVGILYLGVGSPIAARKVVDSQEAMIVLIRRQKNFQDDSKCGDCEYGTLTSI